MSAERVSDLPGDNGSTLSVRDRFLAWMVTGPLGRTAAFALDFAGALAQAGADRLRRTLSQRR